MTTDEIMLKLREIAPSVVFEVRREIDHNYEWDGDGPDPRDDGMDAYDVIVKASAVVAGELLEGEGAIGGCYFREDEEIGDNGGYLLQKLQEAAIELYDQVPGSHLAYGELEELDKFLRGEMRRRYDEQRAGK